MATSIAGNSSFTQIKYSAGSRTDIQASHGRFIDLTADSVEVGFLSFRNSFPGKGVLHQVVGYAPTAFVTAAINASYFLNIAPGLTAASAVTDEQLLVLPTGAQIVGAQVTNNGTTVVGGTTFDIGTEVWSAAPTGTANIAAAMLLATVNAGGSVGQLAPSAFGTAGTANAILAATAANTGVTVQTLVAPNTAGDLAVTLYYLL